MTLYRKGFHTILGGEGVTGELSSPAGWNAGVERVDQGIYRLSIAVYSAGYSGPM
jgi:hypothetical protein